MLESLRRLPVDVFHLTPGDLHEWERLSQLESPTRVVSSNLVPADDSLPAPQPFAIVDFDSPAGRIRIGFLGVSDPAAVRPNSRFRAVPPREALETYLPKVSPQADVVVLLADLPADAAGELADAFREIDVVVRGEARAIANSPQIAGNAVVVSTVERGRSLGKLTLKLSADGRVESAEPEWIALDQNIPEDPHFKARENELAQLP